MWNCNCSSWLKWCWEKYNSTAIGTFLWGLLTFILIINFIFLLWVGEECCASIGFFFLQPSRGCITVSGEDVRTFDKSEWARVVSIVNQVCTYSYISDTCIHALMLVILHLIWFDPLMLNWLGWQTRNHLRFYSDMIDFGQMNIPYLYIYIYIHSICIFLWIQIYWKHVCNCSWFILHIEVQFSGFCFGSLGKVSFRIGKLKVWVGSVSESVRREHWIGLIWPSRVGFI